MVKRRTRPGALVCTLVLGPAAAVALAAVLAPASGPASAGAEQPKLPAPPPNGVMGFVVENFAPPVVQDKNACPKGLTPKVKDVYLASLPEAERARLLLKENEPELAKRWQASVFGSNGTNICSQPDMFERPLFHTVQSSMAGGVDLDEGASEDTCSHEEFTAPDGRSGIDNQEYRVMGCTLEWRGRDGIAGDQTVGTREFHASGQWTQVILLRGVDSLVNDDAVEVIYANTADRPLRDTKGHFLRGASFTVNAEPPRYRNALKGRIENGVLTTMPQDIHLSQTWGQGGPRDIRGSRSIYDFRRGRLRLAFQPDGSLKGVVGGYKPVFDVIQSPAIGGAGSALTAGIDCAGNLATLRKYADGLRDPKTGKCTAVSSAMEIKAVPAFVNDIGPGKGAGGKPL